MAGGWLWIRVSEEWGRCAPQSLCRVVSEFVGHYHAERNHQGLGNRLIRLFTAKQLRHTPCNTPQSHLQVLPPTKESTVCLPSST